MSGDKSEKPRYGCMDYREEMRLMGLKRLIEKEGISDAEREAAMREIANLEKKMGMD